MSEATWDNLSYLQFDAEEKTNELNDLIEAVWSWKIDDFQGAEGHVVQAIEKAGELAKTAVNVIGVLDELLAEIRKAKGVEDEQTQDGEG